MGKFKIGIDISAELMKIDGKISEARKAGNKKKVAELRQDHSQLSKLQGQGYTKIPGDKKPAARTETGPETPDTTESESQTESTTD